MKAVLVGVDVDVGDRVGGGAGSCTEIGLFRVAVSVLLHALLPALVHAAAVEVVWAPVVLPAAVGRG